MPCDRLSFAVRIAREINFIRFLDGGLQFRDYLLLALRYDVRRDERPLILSGLDNLDGAVLGRKIAYMTDRTLDREFAAKILAYRFRLCGRFYYQ